MDKYFEEIRKQLRLEMDVCRSQMVELNAKLAAYYAMGKFIDNTEATYVADIGRRSKQVE